MNERLEQFIKNNLDRFDSGLPDAGRWTSIERALNRLPHTDQVERFLLENRPMVDLEVVPATAWERICNSLDQPTHDPLERFIAEKRADFDLHEPPAMRWKGANGGPKLGFSLGKYLLRAAAMVALLVTGAGMGIWYANNQQSAEPGMAMSEVSTEYAELEQYFENDITAKETQLSRFANFHSEPVLQDIRQIDQAMDELRLELATVPEANRETVIRAMIENYKAKAAILQRVLEHLNEQTKVKLNSKNHETTRI